ncbi:MAG: YegS/Rv2252/BmrU family lipid kinase [Propionibacteriales bacterium]|nr:YegS/Rv2252/BmrU family lipid kinase [Propionibacteriales bacterium]
MTQHVEGSSLTLVVNPYAGRGRSAKLLPKVTAALVAGLPSNSLKVIRTTSWEESQQRCAEVVAEASANVAKGRNDPLLVMGGDGMMHLGLNAAAQSGVPLGLIPAGRGNDFCRGVGVPTDPLAAVQTIVEGHLRKIDLASVTGKMVDGTDHRWVGCIVSTGFDGRVGYRADQMKRSYGGLEYAVATLAELRTFEPLTYRILIDGVARQQTAMFIAVGNAAYYGGGMQACPQADLGDGLLDLTVINPVSRATLIRLLPTMFTGGFVKDPAVELLRAKEVVIDGDGLYAMADGEELGPVPITVRAVREALTIYVPAGR